MPAEEEKVNLNIVVYNGENCSTTVAAAVGEITSPISLRINMSAIAMEDLQRSVLMRRHVL